MRKEIIELYENEDLFADRSPIHFAAGSVWMNVDGDIVEIPIGRMSKIVRRIKDCASKKTYSLKCDGFIGSIKISIKTGGLYGRIAGREDIRYHGKTLKQLNKNFRKAVMALHEKLADEK